MSLSFIELKVEKFKNNLQPSSGGLLVLLRKEHYDKSFGC